MSDMEPVYRIGVDVGGTFTDVAVVDAGRLRVAKTLTTISDPSIGTLNAVRSILDDIGPVKAATLIHATTLVTNGILERKGAKVGLITTAGFRDVLEIGREPRYDLFDLNLDKPAPLVPRSLRHEVRERILADGEIAVPLDADDVRRAAGLLREAECEAVAVVLLHAYRNSAHELKVAAILREEFPELDVSISSDVAPEIGEYVRTSTTVANAYVRPMVRSYVQRLNAKLADAGLDARLLLMQSNGGLATPDHVIRNPIELLESGPAAGAIAAALCGKQAGFTDLISFDMGGTTAKICVIANGTPIRTTEFEAARLDRFRRGSGLPLRVSTIELLEIGAGGGSIASVDALGLLKVGPRSAGSEPGPACYGRGGRDATVTDADLVLGCLSAEHFLGGAMRLDEDAAVATLARNVGEPLGVAVTDAARGIVAAVNAQMASAVRLHAVERGYDPKSLAMIAFGGAGPVHAYDLARRVGIATIIYPPNAGVASATGLLVAEPTVEISRSHYVRLDDVDEDELTVFLRALAQETRGRFEGMGFGTGAALSVEVAMQYAGQGHRVDVSLPADAANRDLGALLRERFEETYRSAYGHVLGERRIEALTWRAVARLEGADSAHSDGHGLCEDGAAEKGERVVHFVDREGAMPCRVFDRYRLKPGTELAGPAIVEERESTIVIGPSRRARVDERLNVIVDVTQDC